MHHARRNRQAPDLPRRYVDVADDSGFFQADETRSDEARGFDRGVMQVIAAHLIRFGQNHVHVLLCGELRIGQRLEQRAARVAMRLDRLHDDPRRCCIHGARV